MKRRGVVLLMIVLVVPTLTSQEKDSGRGLFSWFRRQEKMLLPAVFLTSNNSFYRYRGGTGSLPPGDFVDSTLGLGLGSTIFFGSRWGVYTAAAWYLPLGYSRTTDGISGSGGGWFRGFRVGNTGMLGGGYFRGDRDRGVLTGAGLYTDIAFYNQYPGLNARNIILFNVGPGAGVDLYGRVRGGPVLTAGLKVFWIPLQFALGGENELKTTHDFAGSFGITLTVGMQFNLRRAETEAD